MERAQLWAAYKESRTSLGRNNDYTLEALDRFNGANYHYRNYSRTRQCQYEKKLVDLLGIAPKAFHSYLRERKKGCPKVGPLRETNGSLISDKYRMSEVFAEAFASVFVTCHPNSPHDHQRSEIRMDDICIRYSSVRDVLNNLDGSSSPGPDGLHPMVLNMCGEILSLPLAIIFQKSLDTSILPQEWKVSRVIPIFKSGSKANPLNYRPVSLTSTCCKVLERIIVEQMRVYLEENNFLAKQQFGFRKARSTEDQLLLTYSAVATEVDQGKVVDVVYLDYSKAFDVVNHSVLLEKLRCLGFSQQLVNWIEGFLRGRRMFVSVGGKDSRSVEVGSGVPQGSVLGPLLFLVYANFIANSCQNGWFAFADDFKLYCAYPKGDSVTGVDGLQADLDIVYERSGSWNLKLNSSKCVVMRFGVVSTERIVGVGSGYFLGGQELGLVGSHRDLGVIVDCSLKFHAHISSITCRRRRLWDSF